MSAQIYTPALSNIDKTLEQFLMFGRYLDSLGYPGTPLFIKFIEGQKRVVEGWVANPDTLLRSKQEKLAKQISEAEALGAPPEMIQSLRDKGQIHVHQVVSERISLMTTGIQEAFSKLVKSPLQEVLVHNNLSPDLYAYIILMENQVQYLSTSAQLLTVANAGEQILASFPHIKYGVMQEQVANQLDSVVNMAKNVADISAIMTIFGSAYFLPTRHLMVATVSFASLYAVGRPVLERVKQIMSSNITSRLDPWLLGTDVFVKRSQVLLQALESVDRQRLIIPLPPVMHVAEAKTQFEALTAGLNRENIELFKTTYLGSNSNALLQMIEFAKTEGKEHVLQFVSQNANAAQELFLHNILGVVRDIHAYCIAEKIPLSTEVKNLFTPLLEDQLRYLRGVEAGRVAGTLNQDMIDTIYGDITGKCYKALYSLAYMPNNSAQFSQDSLVQDRLAIMTQSLLSGLNTVLYPQNALTATIPNMPFKAIHHLFGIHVMSQKLEWLQGYFKTCAAGSVVVHAQPGEVLQAQQAPQPLGAELSIHQKVFLFSSGGGGHKQAMEAMRRTDLERSVEREAVPANYQARSIDLMLDWLGSVGEWSVNQWNDAQKQGDVAKQEQLVSQQPLGNFFFGPIIFWKTYKLLEQNPEILEIVNTQAMCNQQVCQAVLEINRRFNRNVHIRLMMTDLPTEKAVHFWNSLKALSPLERSVITVYSIKPMVQNVQAFFDEHCGAGLKVEIAQPPVRKEFLAGEHRSRKHIIEECYLTYKANNPVEIAVLQNQNESSGDNQFKIHIGPDETVMSIMLGSQGGAAILEYVKKVVEDFKRNGNPENPLIFFVYCGSGATDASVLFKNVSEYLATVQPLPAGLRVLPLGNQGPLAIAEGLERADKVIMRTGGLASFEALVMNEQNPGKEFLLHSESHETDPKAQLAAIPVWEQGNAEYLIQQFGARVVNAETFLNRNPVVVNNENQDRVMLHQLHSGSNTQSTSSQNTLNRRPSPSL
ncbi:MAG TPA: hypothetical protein VNK03_07200 [Gammaproteobacteria bacterium]|nr:hypothetical protein [Gammaproteobacteria bacterium]